MTTSADAVVVGRVVNISPGRVFGEPGDQVIYGNGALQIDRIVWDTQRSLLPDSINLEVMLPDAGVDAALRGSLPTSPGVYFLRNKGVSAAQAGYALEAQLANAPYWRLVSSQGLLENVAGSVEAPVVPAEEGGFPSDLEGSSFQALLERVQQAASAAELAIGRE
jgi:hypothetical protein